MTAPHWDLAHDIEAAVNRLRQLTVRAQENEALIAKLTHGDDHVEARLAAEARVAELEAKLQRAYRERDEMIGRNAEQGRQLQAIRRALNGGGTNLVDHAYKVFRALIDAAPNHPLIDGNEAKPSEPGETR